MITTRIFQLVLVIMLLPAVLQADSPAQTYTTTTSLVVYSRTQASTLSVGVTTLSGSTTSAYGVSVGTIPASYTSSSTGQQVCFYVPYHFNVESSVGEVIGSVSASSPFNFYLMSQSQYDAFVAGNPPCGSSYAAITLGYLERTFSVNFTPSPGDYYLILENIASTSITYTIELSAIAKASSIIYSTMETTQLTTLTETASQPILFNSQPAVTTQPASSISVSFAGAIFAILLVVALAVFISLKRRHRKEEEKTRVY